MLQTVDQGQSIICVTQFNDPHTVLGVASGGYPGLDAGPGSRALNRGEVGWTHGSTQGVDCSTERFSSLRGFWIVSTLRMVERIRWGLVSLVTIRQVTAWKPIPEHFSE